MKRIFLLLIILCNLQINFGLCDDWPKWRGTNGNGISDENNWDPLAIENANVIWEDNVGLGYSAVVVRGDHLYTMGNIETIPGNPETGMDVIYCLHAKTGKEIWRYSYPCQTDNAWPGPTATPALDGDRLYTISDDTGDIYCLKANNGQVNWKVNVVSKFGTIPPYDGVGYAGSPYIEGDLLLLNLNKSGIALNKNTGEAVWASESGRCSFSTPVLFHHNSKKKMALFGAKKLFILDFTTGSIEGSFDWDTNCNENTGDPLIIGDKIFISSAYGKGCAMVQLTNGDPKLLWKNMEMSNQFNCSVFYEGYIYGIDGERPRCALKCLDSKTGKEVWSHKMPYSTLIIADGKLVVMDEKGVLHIAEATPKGYQEISSCKVQMSNNKSVRNGRMKRTYWWTNPVLANGFIYLRSDKGDIVCLDARNSKYSER